MKVVLISPKGHGARAGVSHYSTKYLKDMVGKRSYHSQSGVDMLRSDKEYTLIHYIQIRFG